MFSMAEIESARALRGEKKKGWDSYNLTYVTYFVTATNSPSVTRPFFNSLLDKHVR